MMRRRVRTWRGRSGKPYFAEALEPRCMLSVQPVQPIGIGTADSSPAGFTPYNGIVVFAADGSQGRELWRTDGTTAGTQLVADLYPGGTSQSTNSSGPSSFTPFNNAVYFTATDAQGIELWKTDGTFAGTSVVKALHASSVNTMTVVQNRLMFFVGSTLWSSDGSTTGTAAVTGPLAGVGPIVSAGPYAYFIGNDGTHGYELWRTDSTFTTATMVVDLWPGGNQSSITNLCAVGTRALFQASDGTHGTQVWASDGTAINTVALTPTTISPFNLTPAGTQGFFLNDTGSAVILYRTDGTVGGTAMVTTMYPNLGAGAPQQMTGFNNQLFFSFPGTGTGTELWKSNGTAAGTIIVKDIAPGATSSNPGSLTIVGNWLYFFANDGAGKNGLWKTDGTTAGTTFFGNPAYPITSPATANGEVIYAGRSWGGTEPFANDGTAAGTIQLADINLNAAPQAQFGNGIRVGNYVYFNGPTPGYPSGAAGLWRTDGTTAGTICLGATSANAPGIDFANQAVVGPDGHLYYISIYGALCTSDGTVAGTRIVKAIDNYPPNGTFMAVGGNLMYFDARGPGIPAGTDALWRTDGTDAGTVQLPVYGLNLLRTGAQLGNYFYIGAPVPAGSSNSQGLWRTDGTVAGTSVVLQPDGTLIQPGSGVNVVAASQSAVFFTAGVGAGAPLCATNGTVAGSVQLPVGTAGGITSIVFSGTFYYTVGFNGSNNLWKSDGTVAGTVVVANLDGGQPATQQVQLQMITVGNVFYFNGGSLWKSDGTTAGTAQLFTAGSTTQPNNVEHMYAAGSTLYFQSYNYNNFTSVTSFDWWRTDGTPAGTVLDTPTTGGGPLAVTPLAGIDNAYGPALLVAVGTTFGAPTLARMSPGVTLGAIQGQIYQDVNNNGRFDAVDGALAGRQVYLDMNGNGQLDDGEDWVYSDGQGAYWFGAMAAGTYTVRQVLPTGWVQTSNGGGGSSVTVGNTVVSGANLGSAETVPVANPGGRYVVLANGQITLDATQSFSRAGAITLYEWAFNFDPNQPFVVSATGLHPNYVALATTGSWLIGLRVTDSTGQTSTTVGTYVQVVPPDSVTGRVFEDANHNGISDAGESAMRGVTVYADLNLNGIPDAAEPSAVTDITGTYVLPGLAHGTYALREVVPPGYGQTGPTGYTASATPSDVSIVTASAFANVTVTAVTMDAVYLSLLNAHLGQPGTFANGDLNGDGTVDTSDLLVFNENSGHPVGGLLNGRSGADSITLAEDIDHEHIDWTMGGSSGQIMVNDSRGLTINGGGGSDLITLDFSSGGGPLPKTFHINGTFTVSGLQGVNRLAGAAIDIGQSTVFLSYGAGTSPASQIQQALARGFNGGSWNGAASPTLGVIASTAAATGPLNAFAVGFADSADGLVAGQPANTVEVRYTVSGDTNLDRIVDSTDAITMARNYLIAGKTNWDLGNFNYDGTINLSDAQILQKNFNAKFAGTAFVSTATVAITSLPPSASQDPGPTSATTTPHSPQADPSDNSAVSDKTKHNTRHGKRRRA